ncbi:MAG: response regulator transcription factor [Hyphomicrobium sp.]|nr:response regulator transcription factor [Hyphomicrobium sp.]
MVDTIRIAVVDDHPLLRDGVVSTLQLEDDIEVVAVGASADDALRIALDEKPDIMLLDISMPGSGLNAARSIAERQLGVRTIMLTVSEREEDLTTAMEVGAHGYVLKGITGNDLVNTIRTVHRGETYITPQFAARLLTSMKRKPANERSIQQRAQPELTLREEQILKEVSAGLTNKEIARKLTLSEKTVKHYMTNVLQKLHARNRVEAVIAMQKAGKIPE